MADDESIELPEEMFDGDEKAVLAPVFAGGYMESEIVRSLLESHDIPAVVFGAGYSGLEENVAMGDRVMVRAMDVKAALEVIHSAEIGEGDILQPDPDDIEVMVDENYEEPVGATTAEWEDSAETDASGWDEPEVEVLAGRSDWGPRIAGLVGLAALIAVVVVLIAQAD